MFCEQDVYLHLTSLQLQQAEEWQWSEEYKEQREIMEEYYD